jgi:hypothetical protein
MKMSMSKGRVSGGGAAILRMPVSRPGMNAQFSNPNLETND